MKNGFKTIDEIKHYCENEKVNIGFSENNSVYGKSHYINGNRVSNSLAVLPMEGCDAIPDGSPSELTLKRYLKFGLGGAGIIWCEAAAVVKEGRASGRQLYINKANVDAFKSLVDEVKEKAIKQNGYAPVMILQLTHSGRYSKPEGKPTPIIAAHNPVVDTKYNICPDKELISDDELSELEDRFVQAAMLAQAAGFDGVDIKASHGYLLGELLGAHTREGKYGGDYEGRTRFIKNAVQKIKQSVHNNMIVASRLSIYDAMDYPYGFGADKLTAGKPDITEPVMLLNDLFQLGVRLCAVTMGNPYYNPHINRPFSMGPYTPPELPVKGVERLISLAASVKESVPGILFIGAGYSWLKQFAVHAGAYTLEHHHADIIGFGRMAFANPNFANDILHNGCLEAKQTCITCTKCVELMRDMVTTGCVIRDRFYAELYQQHMNNKSQGGN